MHRIFIAVLLLLCGSSASAEFAFFIEKHKNYVNGVKGLGGSMLTISPNGKSLYVIGFAPGSVAVFNRSPEQGTLAFQEAHIDEINGIDGLYGARSIEISPDGKFVYVAGSYDQALVVFTRDLDTGLLSQDSVLKPASSNPEGVSIIHTVRTSPDGDKLFMAGLNSRADAYVLASYNRDSVTGAIDFVSQIQYNILDKSGEPGLYGGTRFSTSCNGKNLYVAGQFGNSLLVVAVEPTTGELTTIQSLQDQVNDVSGLYQVFNTYADPIGRFVYSVGRVAELGNIAIGLYRRNSNDGKLEFLGLTTDIHSDLYAPISPSTLHMSSNGTFAIAPNSQFDSLIRFDRNQVSGRLIFDEVLESGVPGLDGVGQPKFAAASKDGRYLYTLSNEEHSIIVFGLSFSNIISANGFESCLD